MQLPSFWKILLFILILINFLFLFRSTRKETVLVTGGLGFIGSNLVDELLTEFDVIIFDDKSTGNNFNEKATCIIGDISEVDHFKLIPNNVKVDYIIHFGAAISVTESMVNPQKYHRINVLGSKNVLDWAVKNHVRKFVAASSASVYGVPKDIPLREDSPTSPISPYAESKLLMEQLMEKYNKKYGIVAIALRFFNVYGPRQNPDSQYSGVISKFIDSASKNISLKIFGDGTNTRDFIFVKDVCQANIMALKNGKGFHVYNVGTGVETELNELSKQIIEISKSFSKLQYFPAKEGDIQFSLANISKIQQDLDWYPEVHLKKGLKETINWYTNKNKGSKRKSL